MSHPWDNPNGSPDAWGESLALMVGQYYQTMVRAGVPPRTAERLALDYQHQYFQLIVSLKYAETVREDAAEERKRRKG
jgi:hypothetical protein